MRLAELHEDLNHNDRALDLWKSAMKALGRRSAHIFDRMAWIHDRQRNHAVSDRLFEESTKEADGGWAAFNHALAYQRRGKLTEARERVEAALAAEQDAPYFVLLAQIANKQNDTAARDAALKQSQRLFGDVSGLDDWHLHWFRTGAEMHGDQKSAAAAIAEQKRRKTTVITTDAGRLPTVHPGED